MEIIFWNLAPIAATQGRPVTKSRNRVHSNPKNTTPKHCFGQLPKQDSLPLVLEQAPESECAHPKLSKVFKLLVNVKQLMLPTIVREEPHSKTTTSYKQGYSIDELHADFYQIT